MEAAAGLVAIGVGGAVVAPASSRILPVMAIGAVKRKKSCLRQTIERWRGKQPRLLWTVEVIISIINLALYFLDVYADFALCITFYRYGYYERFLIIATLLALPQIVAMIGIGTYFRKQNPCRISRDPHNDKGKKTLFLITSPIWITTCPLLFDIALPFYRVLQSCFPDKFVTFMCQYGAMRILSGALFGSFPQLVLQLCMASDNADMEEEPRQALVAALSVSAASVAFRIVQVYFEMKKEQLNFRGYLQSLVEMGWGLPLRAISNNAIAQLKVDFELLPAQLRSLASVMKENTSLRKIDLSNCKMDDEGCLILAPALTKLTIVNRLDLDNNKIGDQGLEDLSKAFPEMKSLTTLYLSNNKIGDKGMEKFSHALPEMKALNRLDLDNNKIGDHGIEHLANALPHSKALNRLDLDLNKIGPRGMKYLASALSLVKTLKVLDLDHNQIGDQGIGYLCNALPSMKALKWLRLSHNQIGDDSIPSITNALANGIAVDYLSLNNNSFSRKGEKAVTKAWHAARKGFGLSLDD
jgi:hypothetical protein